MAWRRSQVASFWILDIGDSSSALLAHEDHARAMVTISVVAVDAAERDGRIVGMSFALARP
jgi:hypothetical protein